MNKINAILATCVLSSGVATAQDMDTLERVQLDAATRASLNDQWMLGRVGGFVQTGWEYSNGGGLPAQNGFSVDRARLVLEGDMTDESMSYLVSGEWSDQTSTFDLLDAVVTLRMFDIANIRVGQFVPQFYDGFVNDPTQLTTFNYSVTALTFGQGRGQGVEVFKNIGDIELSGFYNNGFDVYGVGDNNFAVGGHARVHFGDGFSVSAGYALNEVADSSVNSYTVSAAWHDGPIAFNVDWINNDEGDDWDNWSVVTTLGYECFDNFQGFAQWEYGQYDGDLNLLTLGGNYHLNEYVTWTNSVGYSVTDLGSNFVTDNTGWRAGGEDGQWVARSVITFSF